MSVYLRMLNDSNDRQRQAIDRLEHCVVLAGPGTGKTRTLTLKAAKLLFEEVSPPRGLACVTYTQNMAHELVNRLVDLGIRTHRNVFIGTLHGFCLTNVLIPFADLFDYPLPKPIRVMSEPDQAKIYRDLWSNGAYAGMLPGFEPERSGLDGWRPRLPIEFQRYRRTNLDGNRDAGSIPTAEKLMSDYESALLERGYIDFDMQIKWSMQLVESQEYVRRSLQARFPWLLVDEYQDVGLPLHRMVKALTQLENIKLFAIGDVNQCIYGFSGASPDHLTELSIDTRTYGPPIVLVKNYRFLERIAEAASAIAPIQSSLEVERLKSPGSIEVLHSSRVFAEDFWNDLIRHVPYQEIMVLHRTWNGCREAASLLGGLPTKIPYFIGDKAKFDMRRPLLDWIGKLMTLTYQVKITNSIALRDVFPFWTILLQVNGISKFEAESLSSRMQLFSTLVDLSNYVDNVGQWLDRLDKGLALGTKLKQYALRSPDEVLEFEKFRTAVTKDGGLYGHSIDQLQHQVLQKERVYVGTVHSSKGKEARVVIIAGAESFNSRDQTKQEELRRLFYVGITRAKDRLVVSYNRKSYLASILPHARNGAK